MSLYRRLVAWIMTTRLYKKLLADVIPFIRLTTRYPRLKGKHYHKAYSLLQAGDIILSADKWKLTGLLIPGKVDHAALFIGHGTDQCPEIYEMTHKGFTKSHFFDTCKESDRVIILRCTDFEPWYVHEMISYIENYSHVGYDQMFELGVEALYCSELIYVADFEKRGKYNLEDLVGLGRPYISPQGLLDVENFKVIYDSDKE